MRNEDLLQWLDEADDLRHRHPRRALLKARALRDLAATLKCPAEDADPESRRRWRRIQSASWAVLGSAYRSVSERARAESALAVALGFIAPEADEQERGSAEIDLAETDLDYARLAQRLSYVRCDQQRFEEALALNDDAVRLFDRAAAPHLAASARVDRALFFHRRGQTWRAIPLLVHALGHLDAGNQPRVFLAAVHNLGFYLSLEARDAEQQQEAVAWLELGWQLHLDNPEEPGLLRLRAVAALMALRRGRVEEAVEALASCRAGFAQLGAVAEQASVLLHLVALAFDEQRPDEARALAAQLHPILHHLELPEPARSLLDRFLVDGTLVAPEDLRFEPGPELDAWPEGDPSAGDGLEVEGDLSYEGFAESPYLQSELPRSELSRSELSRSELSQSPSSPLRAPSSPKENALDLDAGSPSSVPSTEPAADSDPRGSRSF